MASMAAAIAASRSAVMNGNRPLDDKERKRFTYFSSLSPMARKIMQDKEKIREKYGPEWERLPPAQQDEIMDQHLVGPHVQARYAAHRAAAQDPVPDNFHGPRGPTGQKIVHFGDEDITWQDEHSAPFSWETRSQMEFSISSLSVQDPGSAAQALKASQGSKAPGPDSLGLIRKDEEAAFWKINAERSRVEGPEAEFHSLTPSQIKSMEKGEKVVSACLRQEPAPKDKETQAERPSGPRQESHDLSDPGPGSERERPLPLQVPVSPPREAIPAEHVRKPPTPDASQEDGGQAVISEPTPAQVNSSNVILKTGFDFLDNW
ncbi:PREDICTED: uncharacterized protein C1orf198 homolog [Chrysochloris asiatica]|uniref:Uncharacterized protein C1orf198 homolog n=1 Tax=Chrysochloris asiatica TaxID=185453 RepID=A0A9B0U649_CHRAS|nr:PREDICTED: uncharacterized protein C1orf198 homolog [Chrysochloris asiatica]